MRRATAIALAPLGLLLLWAPHVEAQGMHTVRGGQSLALIARRNHVSVSDLAAANGMRPTDLLRPGQVLEVPSRGVVYVRRGQTLSHIARANHCTVAELQRANRLRANARIRVGQRLLLPGHDALVTRQPQDWGEPEFPGVVRVRTREGETVVVPLRNEEGAVLERGLEQLAQLMTRADREQDGVRSRRPHPRLGLLLASISDHFGGRPMVLVSGFREEGGYTRETSRHVSGQATDINIIGVTKREIWDYCRSLSATGCGLYPRSVFVHIDVRADEAQWVDWSGQGQRPRYGNLRGPFPRSRRARLRTPHVGRHITRPEALPSDVEVAGQGWTSGFQPVEASPGG